MQGVSANRLLSQKAVWQPISACQLWNVKCSRNVPLRIRPWLPTVLTRILLTSVARHKRANRRPQAYTPSEDGLALKVLAGRRQVEGRQELRRSPYIIQYNSLSTCFLNLFTKSCWLYALTAKDAVLKIETSWNNRLAPSWPRSLFQIAMEEK